MCDVGKLVKEIAVPLAVAAAPPLLNAALRPSQSKQQFTPQPTSVPQGPKQQKVSTSFSKPQGPMELPQFLMGSGGLSSQMTPQQITSRIGAGAKSGQDRFMDPRARDVFKRYMLQQYGGQNVQGSAPGYLPGYLQATGTGWNQSHPNQLAAMLSAL